MLVEEHRHSDWNLVSGSTNTSHFLYATPRLVGGTLNGSCAGIGLSRAGRDTDLMGRWGRCGRGRWLGEGWFRLAIGSAVGLHLNFIPRVDTESRGGQNKCFRNHRHYTQQCSWITKKKLKATLDQMMHCTNTLGTTFPYLDTACASNSFDFLWYISAQYST